MGLDYTNIIKVSKEDTADMIDYLENRYKFYFLGKDCSGLISLSNKLEKPFIINEVGAIVDLNDEENILYCKSIRSYPNGLCFKFDCTVVTRDTDGKYSVESRDISNSVHNTRGRLISLYGEDMILYLLGISLNN